MTPLTSNSDLQDVNTWHNIINYILNFPRGTTSESAIVSPNFDTLRDNIEAGRDIQTNGRKSIGWDIFVSQPVSLTITAVMPSPTLHFDMTYFGTGLSNFWFRVQELNWWGRIAWSPSLLAKTTIYPDVGPHKFGGTPIALQVGWHVDRIASFNYNLDMLAQLAQDFKFHNGELDIHFTPKPIPRFLGPRCIKEVTDQVWYPKPRNTIVGVAGRPAYAGMMAIRPHGQYANLENLSFTGTNPHPMGPWRQDLHVYQYNGNRWIAKKEIHGKSVEPDTLDSESLNPNFEFYDRDVRSDWRAYQNYFSYKTINSILGL